MYVLTPEVKAELRAICTVYLVAAGTSVQVRVGLNVDWSAPLDGDVRVGGGGGLGVKNSVGVEGKLELVPTAATVQ